MSNSDLFQKVKKLQLPQGEYALFGSAPLGIRGLKECNDIDIIVTQKLWEELKNKSWKIKIAPHGSEYFEYDEMEFWKDWRPGEWNIDELIQAAEIIEELSFVGLEQVLKWKKMMAREKDFKDIKRIEEFLQKIQ